MSVVERHELLNAASPRPWSADHGSISYIRDGADDNDLFSIDCSYELDAAAAQAHADVDLIVGAVNEYEALIACEAGLRALVGFLRPDNRHALHARDALERLDQIRKPA